MLGNLSTRTRLMLLLVLAAIPALALTVYTSVTQRVAAASQAREDITSLARIGAQQQSQIVDGAKQLLIGFSLVPADMRNDRERCSEYVRQVLQKTAGLYSSMGLYGPDGDVKCAGSFLDRGAQRATESGQFAIGEYPRPPPSKPDGFTLNYPIVDAQRNMVDVAFVVLNLTEFGELAAKLPLPDATVLTVVDRNGIVLARTPGGNGFVGRKVEPAQVLENMLTGASGVFSGGSADGAQLYAWQSVNEMNGATAVRVLVGVPLSAVYAGANETLIKTLAGVLVVTLLLLVGAWYGVERFFLRNVRTLLSAANRIRAGDLGARTGMNYGNEELSRIGKAFDEMAETLHERQKRIDSAITTLQQQAITDALTGVNNRRYLYETLPREIVRAKRAGTTIGVVVIDLDHFKRINDSYGHEAGDMVLRWVGNVLLKSTRGSDIVCRYGGEEFCVVLPEVSSASVQAKADEIRRALMELNLDYCGKPLKITASFGAAIYPEHGEDADTLLRLADEALYRAKGAGRNRVEVYSREPAVQEVRLAATATERVAATSASPPSTASVSKIKTASFARAPQQPPLPVVQSDGAPDRAAALQVLTGPIVGKEFPLANVATSIGKAGDEIAMITRSAHGYFLTHVEGPRFPVVNGSTIESRARRLADHDVIEVAKVKIVFFYK
ncbi:MAG: diguanylate cyclase [Burkholderiales bacterium]